MSDWAVVTERPHGVAEGRGVMHARKDGLAEGRSVGGGMKDGSMMDVYMVRWMT